MPQRSNVKTAALLLDPTKPFFVGASMTQRSGISRVRKKVAWAALP